MNADRAHERAQMQLAWSGHRCPVLSLAPSWIGCRRHRNIRCGSAKGCYLRPSLNHDAPPVTLDRPLEVGSDDWQGPGFYQLMTALVVPRPVGWISTISKTGVPNVAPYSYFNLMGSDPPYVAFGSSGIKDSLANLREVPEFVANIVTMHLLERMNFTSGDFPREEDEFDRAGLTAVPAAKVRPFRVGEAKAHLEMRGRADRDRPQYQHRARTHHTCPCRSVSLEERACRSETARPGLPAVRLGLCRTRHPGERATSAVEEHRGHHRARGDAAGGEAIACQSGSPAACRPAGRIAGKAAFID
jgi:flavin reductase (DIM6/NTAB) family NADH-FMN oxidoreductase RutF